MKGVVLYIKSSILLAGSAISKISTVACGSSPIKAHYFDYLKRYINRINEVNVFFLNKNIVIFY